MIKQWNAIHVDKHARISEVSKTRKLINPALETFSKLSTQIFNFKGLHKFLRMVIESNNLIPRGFRFDVRCLPEQVVNKFNLMSQHANDKEAHLVLLYRP